MYSKPCQTLSTLTEIFAKIVNDFQPLTIFAKSSISDVWQGIEFAATERLEEMLSD